MDNRSVHRENNTSNHKFQVIIYIYMCERDRSPRTVVVVYIYIYDKQREEKSRWRWRATNHDVPAVRALLYLRTMHRRNNTAVRFVAADDGSLLSRPTLYVTEKDHFPDTTCGTIRFLIVNTRERCPPVQTTRDTYVFHFCAMPAERGPPLILVSLGLRDWHRLKRITSGYMHGSLGIS